MNPTDRSRVKAELDRLTEAFFGAVSFEPGAMPPYDNIRDLFIEAGLLIKNTSSTPEISSIAQFIQPRLASVESGELSRFSEAELVESTEIFGNVAHRFSSYIKSGTLNGVDFAARGMITTQFVLTPAGWRISSMAWDDERAGVSIPDHYERSRDPSK